MPHNLCRRLMEEAPKGALECGDSSPLAAIDLPRHRAACRPLISRRLTARPEVGLWYSRQQAARSGQQDDPQSGDESPHSRGAFGAMIQKLWGIGRGARAPLPFERQ